MKIYECVTLMLTTIFSIPTDVYSKDPTLIWSTSTKSGSPQFVTAQGDPDEWIPRLIKDKDESLETTTYEGPKKKFGFRAVAVDAFNEFVFYSNTVDKERYIVEMSLATGESWPVYGATSSRVDGIAYDWVHDNVYWTDSLFNQIGLVSVAHHQRAYNSKIIIHTYIDEPHGIVVHPRRSLIFWTDTGKRTLEKATLSGRDRQVVRQFPEHFNPTSLHLDYHREKLYILDSELDEIHRCDLDGENFEQVTKHNSTMYGHLRGIAMYNDFLFSGDEFNHQILIWNLTNGLLKEHILKMREESDDKELGAIYDVVLSNENDQPLMTSPCYDYPCDKMCVSEPNIHQNNQSNSTKHCLCPTNTEEKADGTCDFSKEVNPPLFMFWNDERMCLFHDWMLNDRLSQRKMRCTHYSLGYNSAIASYYNGTRGFVYDTEPFSILRTELYEKFPKNEIAYSVHNITGITVDWLHDKLYWVSDLDRNLMMANENGTGQVELVSDLEGDPEGLVIDPILRKLYMFLLVDRNGSNTWILQARNLDGSSPSVLVDTDLISPRRVTIDIMGDGRLYWTDDGAGAIESIRKDGSGRRVVYQNPKSAPFGIAIFRDYMFWTDRGEDTNVGVFWSIKSTGEIIRQYNDRKIRGHEPLKPGDVSAYEDYKHLAKHGDDSCLKENGGCDHHCIPLSAVNHVCKCSWGYVLQQDNRTCKTYTTIGNFLLVSASHTGGIYQIDAIPSSPQLSKMSRMVPVPVDDVPVALALDEEENLLFLSSVHPYLGGRVSLETYNFSSKEFKEIASLRPEEMPRSIALDTTKRMMYVADPEENQIIQLNYEGDKIGRVLPWSRRYDAPWSIAYDPQENYIYWSSLGTFDNHPRIERMNITSKQAELIVVKGKDSLQCPAALRIDQSNRKLYWVDCELGRLEMSNLDGSKRELLYSNNSTKWQTMAIDHDYIYLADWYSRDVYRWNRENKTFDEPFQIGYSRINDLLVYRGHLDIDRATTTVMSSPTTTTVFPTTDQTTPQTPHTTGILTTKALSTFKSSMVSSAPATEKNESSVASSTPVTEDILTSSGITWTFALTSPSTQPVLEASENYGKPRRIKELKNGIVTSSKTPLISGVVVAAMVLIILVIVIVIFRRKSKRRKPEPPVLFRSHDGTMAEQTEIAFENKIYDTLDEVLKQ